MPSSYTTSLRLELMATGELVNVWGDRNNSNVVTRIDTAIAGIVTIALTGDYTLTTANGGADQARYAMLKFTGGAGPYTVTVPSVSKTYRVWNASSATLTFTTGAGTTVQIATTDIVDIFCDGTNVKTPGYGGSSLKDYIASVVVGGGATLPSLVGNAGKWLTNNGTIASWALPTTSDLSDLATYTAARSAFAVAMAVSDISNYASDQAAKTATATALAVAFAVTL